MKRLIIFILAITLVMLTQINYSTDIKLDNQLSASATSAIKKEKESIEAKEETEQEANNTQEETATEVVERVQTTTNYYSESEIIRRSNDSLGTAGRIYLPTINLNVGINYANFYDDENYNAQEIVDREDSAAYFQFGSKTTIADHNYQGFNKIINLSIGAKAYIKKSNGAIEVYQLNNKFAGKNISADLTDSNGNSVQNMNGNLIIYTCYGVGNGIMVTLWDQIA